MSLYKRKDSSVWWYKIRFRGKVLQKSTGTADELKAREFHDKLKASLWDEERLGIKPRRSWQDAAGRWLYETQHKASHADDIAKLKRLHPFLGGLTLDQVTRDVIDAIAKEVAKPHQKKVGNNGTRLVTPKRSTANRYLALVRSILIRARDHWEWIDRVPKIMLFKEPEGRERYLTLEQVSVLLKELPEHQRDTVLFALLTGLRQANVLGLEWDCVNLDKSHAWVSASKSKNRKAISVPLTADALVILQRQLGKHPTRVFTYAGKPIANANTQAWKKALIRAGIENFRWHDLRHTWASWHRMAGTSTPELQRLGAWKTQAMVERYAHLAPEQLEGAVLRLGSMVAGYEWTTLKSE
jgi:integrase